MTEREDWSWLGVRLATADEVAAIDRDPGLRDGAPAWWTVIVDWSDEDNPNPPVGTKVTLPDPPGPFAFDDLDLRVVTQAGPAGGWPEVRVMGPFDRLMAFLASYHDQPEVAWLPRDLFDAAWREVEE